MSASIDLVEHEEHPVFNMMPSPLKACDRFGKLQNKLKRLLCSATEYLFCQISWIDPNKFEKRQPKFIQFLGHFSCHFTTLSSHGIISFSTIEKDRISNDVIS